jgi:threonyl-tRNA synthetase
MNDGHIYCTADQLEQELHAVLDMYAEVYALLGVEGHRFRLSLSDAEDVRGKYVDDAAAWQWSERLLRRVLEERGLDYHEGVGHAAFYGPKIDVQVRTRIGSEETLSTVQLDFAQPARLGLLYTASSGAPATPLCIHRAPLSTHERFVAFLLELYRGAFPLWLAPVQIEVVPVSDAHRAYAEGIVKRLRGRFVRAEVAAARETVARNVRDALELKVPLVAVVGAREERSGRVSLRLFESGRRAEMPVEELEQRLLQAIGERRRGLDLMGSESGMG